MHARFLHLLSVSAFSAPFALVFVLLVYYFLFRSLWRLRRRLARKDSGFCPSPSALGMAFQRSLQAFYQPSVAYVIEAKQDEQADEDDDGDPENLTGKLEPQLRRIRRGEPVDNLTVRR
jgi:hypothetical protein